LDGTEPLLKVEQGRPLWPKSELLAWWPGVLGAAAPAKSQACASSPSVGLEDLRSDLEAQVVGQCEKEAHGIQEGQQGGVPPPDQEEGQVTASATAPAYQSFSHTNKVARPRAGLRQDSRWLAWGQWRCSGPHTRFKL